MKSTRDLVKALKSSSRTSDVEDFKAPDKPYVDVMVKVNKSYYNLKVVPHDTQEKDLKTLVGKVSLLTREMDVEKIIDLMINSKEEVCVPVMKESIREFNQEMN